LEDDILSFHLLVCWSRRLVCGDKTSTRCLQTIYSWTSSSQV